MQRNIFEGSDFLLFDVDNNPIAYCKNSAIKINRALADVTTKDSDGWLDFLNGIKSWSLDFEGLVSYDDSSFSTSYFLSKFKNSEPFFIQFGILQDGFTHTFWGEVATESIEIDSDNGEIVTYSGTLKGIGKLTFTNQGTPEQSGYIKTETDPYFRSSPAHSITNTSINSWNNAFDKTLSEVLFNTTGNTTTLNVKLRDGSLYSTSFNHLGGGGGTVLTGLTFNPSNGNLSVNNLTTNLDGRYQPLGAYVSQQYLTDNHYSKTQSDSRFATFTYVSNEISNLVNSAPSTLDTLQELANALGNDENFSTTITALIATKANASDVYSKLDANSIFQPLENQRLSTSNNVSFNQITANSKLNIPSTSSNKYSLYVDENGIGGTGSTIPVISYLYDLSDVTISNPIDGQTLVFNGSQWVNSTVTSGTFNYNDLYNKPTHLSQFTNDLGLNAIYQPLEDQRLSSNYAPLFTGLRLNSYGGNYYKDILFKQNGLNRWNFYTDGVEGGSDSGSNLYLASYYDDANYKANIFSVNRATSVLNFTSRPTIAGNGIVSNDGDLYNININGNAVTANNALRWNTYEIDLSDYGTSLSFFLGYDNGVGKVRPFSSLQVKSSIGFNDDIHETPNTIVRRDANGYINASFFRNTNEYVRGDVPTTITGEDGNGYFYKFNSSAIQSFVGLNNGSTLYNNISGSAGSVNWSNVVSRPTLLSQFTNDLGLGSIFQPLENQRLSTSSNVVFNQIIANTKLSIPSTSSNKYSIYIDENGLGGGSTPIPIISYLNDLQDVVINSPTSGNVLTYNGSQWINSTITSGTFDYNALYNKPDLSVFAFANGSNSSGTWGINIGGSAARWGNQLWVDTNNADFFTVVTYSIENGGYGYTTVDNFKSKLGLGSLAYLNGLSGAQVNTDISIPNNDIGIAKLLRWKNYGSGHVIFDASNGTAPNGTAIDRTNPQVNYAYSYPTLMGWNGANTFGVRVDSARNADVWGGRTADLQTTQADAGQTISNFVTGGSDGIVRVSFISQVRAALGLTSGAYDLQWVTSNGNLSNNTIFITGSNRTIGNPSVAALYMQQNGNDGATVESYNYSSSTALPLFLNPNGGNVGINTLTPSAKLDVNGNTFVGSYSSDSGGNWMNAQLRVNGINPAIGFHYPTQYGAALYMNSSGVLVWGGNGLYTPSHIWTDGYVQGGRIVAGYDSGVQNSINTNDYLRVAGNTGIWWASHAVALEGLGGSTIQLGTNNSDVNFRLASSGVLRGSLYADSNNSIGFLNSSSGWSFRVDYNGWAFANSFNADNWFRSAGASGWYNSTYQGGIYMEDNTWVRTYNTKGFYVAGGNGIISEGIVKAGTGYGFQNIAYQAGRNRIWSFANADNYGLSYHQGTSSIYGNDGIGIHFGDANNPQFNFLYNGLFYAPTVRATNSLQVPTKNTSGVNTGNHFSIWVEV